jgi:hypothetical protein
MKLSLIKLTLLGILLVFSGSFLRAQDADTEEPAPGATITPDLSLLADYAPQPSVPGLASSSVIHYDNGVSVSVEFTATGTSGVTAKLVDQSNASDTRSLTVQYTKAEVFGVAKNKTYDIKVIGSDGQWYIVGTLNTTQFRAGDPVIVSQNLYRALSKYVLAEGQPSTLSNYLKQLPAVSQHEKISFLQRYVMNGAVLPGSIKGQYPDYYVKEAIKQRQTEGECLCNFVMNQYTAVIPDEDGSNNFSIKEKVERKGPINYNGASFWMHGIKAQGPAKNQFMLNSGHLAGNTRRTETWTMGTENASDNSVRIGYHLMCINFSELPAECDCSKTVKFDYGYYSKVKAFTAAGGFPCVFDRDATATVQDWAVAFLTHENLNSVNDVQVLGAGTNIAASHCNAGVTLDVVIDAVKIGLNVFEVIKSVKNVPLNDLLGQLGQIVDKIGTVLAKFMEIKECENSLIDKPLVQGSASFQFRPNDPITFVIMSGSNLQIMGRRCWESLAQVNSSFHLTGVVVGGSPNPSSTHCCTDYFANWALASQKGDYTSRQNAVKGFLALHSPGGWQNINGSPNTSGNNFSIPSDLGYAVGSQLPGGQRCSKVIDINFNPR